MDWCREEAGLCVLKMISCPIDNLVCLFRKCLDDYGWRAIILTKNKNSNKNNFSISPHYVNYSQNYMKYNKAISLSPSKKIKFVRFLSSRLESATSGSNRIQHKIPTWILYPILCRVSVNSLALEFKKSNLSLPWNTIFVESYHTW